MNKSIVTIKNDDAINNKISGNDKGKFISNFIETNLPKKIVETNLCLLIQRILYVLKQF